MHNLKVKTISDHKFSSAEGVALSSYSTSTTKKLHHHKTFHEGNLQKIKLAILRPPTDDVVIIAYFVFFSCSWLAAWSSTYLNLSTIIMTWRCLHTSQQFVLHKSLWQSSENYGPSYFVFSLKLCRPQRGKRNIVIKLDFFAFKLYRDCGRNVTFKTDHTISDKVGQDHVLQNPSLYNKLMTQSVSDEL